jgi:hypothetical protein
MGGWKLSLLPMPYECERLRELGLPERLLWRLSGAPSADVTQTELYAALSAVGCSRLAFLLTDLDPRDPLDEELASWKRWLTRPLKYEERGEPSLAVVSDGFLIHASDLEPLREELVEGWREGGGAQLDARVAVDRELEKLIELAETGFEGFEMEGFFDRYIEKTAEAKGWYESRLVAGRDCSEEELRRWLALGAGKPGWTPDGSLTALEVKVKRASELPVELKERLRRREEPLLLKALKEVAGLLAVARYAKINAFIFARGT